MLSVMDRAAYGASMSPVPALAGFPTGLGTGFPAASARRSVNSNLLDGRSRWSSTFRLPLDMVRRGIEHMAPFSKFVCSATLRRPEVRPPPGADNSRLH